MFNQFLEKLHLRPKSPPPQSKEISTRENAKMQSSRPGPPQNRVVSLSPDSTVESTQFQRRKMSPDPPSRYQTDQGITNNTRNYNQLNIPFKRNDEKGPYQNTPNFYEKSRNTNNGPNFQFMPLDKESIKGTFLGDSIREGSVLAQNVPGSVTKTATKILFTGPQYNSRPLTSKPIVDNKIAITKENFGGEKFQGYNGNSYRTKENYESSNQRTERRQQEFNQWYAEKRKNDQALVDAAKFGDIQTAIRLLDKKLADSRANVNSKGDNLWTPLHFACLAGNYDFVNLLFFNGANADAETTLKFTPLHIAAQKGYYDIVQLLFNSGANLNATDIYNNTPLHYAAQNGHKRVVQFLLSRPSLRMNVSNNDNKKPHDLAFNQEIRNLFESVISESNMLNSKFTQKIPIHRTKTGDVQQMFEKAPINSGWSSKNPFSNGYESRNPEQVTFQLNRITTSGTSGYLQTKETKCDSEFTEASDEQTQEEKIGPQNFRVLSLLGKGSFGEVYLVEKKDTGVFYAMKVLDKSKVNKYNLVRYVLTERNVLSLTKHPFIVGLNFAFQTTEKLFLILDYCPCGDLGEHLQKEKKFTEDRARMYLAEIVLALEDLHKRDIIFRDLKPDNIVLDSTGHCMLTDFGLSKEGVLDNINGTKSFCGSVAYLAPEMLKRTGHGKAVDWYLLGVVFYEMLVGVPPYYAPSKEQLFANIEKAPLKIPSNLSQDAKSLLIALLQRNPPKRLGSGKNDAEEVKAHPFFAKINWREVEQRKLKVPIPQKKANFGTKVSPDSFDFGDSETAPNARVNGWTFIAPQYQNQPTTSLL